MTSASKLARRVFEWCKTRWYIPLLAIGAIIAWAVTVGRRDPTESVTDELRHIREAEEIKRLAIESGAKIANELIDNEYRRTLQRLDAEAAARADELRSDPSRRIRFLRTIAKRLRDREPDNPNQ